MIGLARLHAYQNGVFWLVDVPQNRARDKQRELSRMGWTVVHTELV
jgi:G:T-mismatch repair DNA endonuclease (very short patch repair protein)